MAIQDPKDHDLRHEARRGGESPAVPAESEPQRYRQGCPKGGECLNGCLSRHPCMYDLPAAPSLPARGSAELHAELAPPPGMGEQIMANLASVAVGAVSKAEQTARTELAERRRDERAAGFGCLRAAIVEARKVIDDAGPHEDPMCEVVRILDDALVATDAPAPAERPALKTSYEFAEAVEKLRDARGVLRHLSNDLHPPSDNTAALHMQKLARECLHRTHAGAEAPAIATDPASVAAEVAAQDAQIAALSLRLAALEQGRESLLAALGRAAEDLGEHQAAWRGLCQLGKLDRTTHSLAVGWWGHAERSGKRIAETITATRAGEDEG